MKKKAYSYIRFSTHQQSFKSSLERQETAIRKWIDNNQEYELMDCSYKDLGISGYTGKHIEKGGMLGKFLEGCNNGIIQEGSVLLVESIDRLGRLSAELMLEIITSLIKKVTIITLEDGQSYAREDINGFKVFQLIIKIQGAHSYSLQLSERLLKGKQVAREKVKSGLLKKYVSNCPSWLTWSQEDECFLAIPSRVEVVRRIFDMYVEEGLGTTAIASKLNTENVDGFNGKGWHGSYIAKILFTRKVLGAIEFNQRDRTGDHCDGYYPQVVDTDTYMKAQSIKESKSKNFRTSDVSHQPPQDIFVNVVRCACGGDAKLYNKGNDNRVYICKNRVRGLCKESSQFSKKLLLLHFCQFIEKKLYQFSMLELQQSQGKSQDLEFSKKDKLVELEKKISSMVERLLHYSDEIFEAHDEDEKAALTTKRNEARSKLDMLKLQQQDLEVKVHMDEIIEVISVNDLELYRKNWGRYYKGQSVRLDPLTLSALSQFLESQQICICLHKDKVEMKFRDDVILTVEYPARTQGLTISRTHDSRIFILAKNSEVVEYGRAFKVHPKAKRAHSKLANSFHLDGVYYDVGTKIFKSPL
ncbi:recombinase family protein [Pseudoalteromonas sp. ACER1]|jgi:DNA invertase Pin-like site-specific DNA recombinase|uniref:recombinase family protein n=1 Tax=unclassified Pseudoalteromonas TaxID=194690 RepID=UPI001F26C94B|nr:MULTISPECIES: recombinase family protein [unclassified Pseudoalteromonas]MCF2849185.1 recombinase family protein [Pseudoalteromonas sp. PAST1]MCO7212659.1 recombinase family protein [Pseudoalteromonas sp. ACER1]